ncbi:MAG: ATP-binding protein, partial [Rubrimonas sp.]
MLRRTPQDAEMAEDLALLRDQSERCRAILGKLTSLGQEEEERPVLEHISLKHVLEEVVDPQRGIGVPIHIFASGEGPEPFCRRNPGLIYGLTNLVDNAVDFAEDEVTIKASWTPDQVRLEIRDDGPGFASDILLRLGEPYVTSRGADKRGLEEKAAG